MDEREHKYLTSSTKHLKKQESIDSSQKKARLFFFKPLAHILLSL